MRKQRQRQSRDRHVRPSQHTASPPSLALASYPPETGPHGSARAINFFHGWANQIKETPRYCAMEGLLKRPGECGPSWADRSTTRPTQTQLNEVQHCPHCNIRGARNIPDTSMTTGSPLKLRDLQSTSCHACFSVCGVQLQWRYHVRYGQACRPAIARLLKRHPYGR